MILPANTGTRNLGTQYGSWTPMQQLHFNRTGQTPADAAQAQRSK
jgi:hypothetical protein